MKILLIIFCVLIVVPIAYLKAATVSGEWRYKVIVEVDTPDGVVTGSAVHQVSNSASDIKIIDLPEAGNPADFKGEAVVVDLGDKGPLFMLVPTSKLFFSAFPVSGASTVRGIKHFNALEVGQSAELNPEYMTKFVMFKDMNDPKSVNLVFGRQFNAETQKNELIDNMAELYGDGYAVSFGTNSRWGRCPETGRENGHFRLAAEGPQEAGAGHYMA
jgi:hypothetical protein